jgi:hypothetical protein
MLYGIAPFVFYDAPFVLKEASDNFREFKY